MIRRVSVAAGAAVSQELLAVGAFAEEAAGSEVNPLNMLLAVVYIVVVMALIYVILLCIDKFAKKRQKNDVTSEEKTEDENSGDGEKDG